jgi:hypothetical protein
MQIVGRIPAKYPAAKWPLPRRNYLHGNVFFKVRGAHKKYVPFDDALECKQATDRLVLIGFFHEDLVTNWKLPERPVSANGTLSGKQLRTHM